jgi:CDP-glucose 4,6-dehydratase
MSTRPWQHVLESISGYLLLGQKLLMRKKEFAEAWNFGPEKDGNQTVKTVLIKLSQNWEGLHWHETDKAQPYEANFLYIDSSKARNKLGWQTVWNFDTNLEKTSEWYRELMLNNNVISRQQLTAYLNAAADVKCEWIK